MRQIFTIITFLISPSCFIHAQFHEVQVGIGTANYYGDLNTSRKNILQPITDHSEFNIKASYSLGYRYHFKEYFSVGAQFNIMSLSGYDSDNYSKGFQNSSYFRYLRNLSFYTNLYELSSQFTYEPYRNDKRWFNYKWFASPYVSAGIGLFKFNPKTMYKGTEYELQPLGTEGQGLPGQKDKYSLTQVSLPITLGLKVYSPNRSMAISMDLSYRYSTTDYLDDVSGNYFSNNLFDTYYDAPTAKLVKALSERRVEIDPTDQYKYITTDKQIRGNKNDNDGFITMQLKFSYFFKQKRKVEKSNFIFVNPRYIN
jgi:hypothetical protein